MNIALRYGFYITIGVVVWTLIEFSMGLHNEHIQIGMITGMFSFIIPIILLYVGIKARRDNELNGNLSFVEGLKTGAGISFIMSVMMAGFFLYYLRLLNPAAIQAIIAIESQYYLEHSSFDIAEMMRIMELLQFALSTKGILAWSFVPPFIGGLMLSALYSKLLQRQMGPISSNGSG